MEYIYIAVAILAIVFVGFVGAKYLKNKGLLTEENFDVVGKILLATNIVADRFVSDKETMKKYTLVNGIISEMVAYVEIIATYSDNKEKKTLAYSAVLSVLNLLGVEVTDDERKIISLGIESAVAMLPDTYKKAEK